MDFSQKLDAIVTSNNSLVCVGLDPELEKLPKGYLSKKDSIHEFNRSIIDSTAHLVCSYKPNIAFYEAYGLDGLDQLKKTMLYLQNDYPQIPIILDAKRADIANTAKMYAKSAFEYWGADAITVYPHLGKDSLQPFFAYNEKLTIILIKTSNPDAKMFQDMKVNGSPYYLKIAQEIVKWSQSNIGLFVGATYPADLEKIRSIFPDKIILCAGFGAQKAQIKAAVPAGINKDKKGIIFNASRSIIYATDPTKAAQNLRDEINKYRQR